VEETSFASGLVDGLVLVVGRPRKVLGHERDIVYSSEVVDEISLFDLEFPSGVLGGVAIKLFDSRLGDLRRYLRWVNRLLRGWFGLRRRWWWWDILKGGCNCFSDGFAYSFGQSNDLLVGFSEFGVGEIYVILELGVDILDEGRELFLSCHIDRRCCCLGSGLENNVSES
jgi:hypothetical protein